MQFSYITDCETIPSRYKDDEFFSNLEILDELIENK